jgi:hypothetical protein
MSTPHPQPAKLAFASRGGGSGSRPEPIPSCVTPRLGLGVHELPFSYDHAPAAAPRNSWMPRPSLGMTRMGVDPIGVEKGARVAAQAKVPAPTSGYGC